MQVSYSKVFLSLSAFIAKVLKYVIELRIDLNNGLKQSLAEVSDFKWGRKKKVKNLRMRGEENR